MACFRHSTSSRRCVQGRVEQLGLGIDLDDRPKAQRPVQHVLIGIVERRPQARVGAERHARIYALGTSLGDRYF